MSADGTVMFPKAVKHGGNLAAAERRFGRPDSGWVDLSTGLNPHPYPLPALDPDIWRRLPSAEQEAILLETAGAFYGAAGAPIAAAPGSQSLIQLLPRLIRASPVAVLGPTYGEHERAWRLAGHVVAPVDDVDAVYSHTRILVLANPNNPDGRLIPAERVALWADAFADRGGLLVVDEAFAEVAPEHSVAGLCGRPGLAVLRSFGKFFGLSGVRLGFVLGDDELIDKVRAALGPWPVSGPAIALGIQALADRAWIEATRQRLSADRARLETLLASRGLQPIGATDLFVLVSDPRALDIAAALGRAGILVREFPDRPELLRFGLPGPDQAWDRLDAALAAL